MTRAHKPVTRRAALKRLGLAMTAGYCSPMVTGLSKAQASSGPSSSPATPASKPSPPSAASAPTAASPVSGPSGAQGANRAANGNQRTTRGTCTGPSGSERIAISRRDMTAANRAVARGEAKTLREIFQIVQGQHRGQVIRVGFNANGRAREYWLRMVARDGAVQTVTVDALTGATLNVKGC